MISGDNILFPQCYIDHPELIYEETKYELKLLTLERITLDQLRIFAAVVRSIYINVAPKVFTIKYVVSICPAGNVHFVYKGRLKFRG